MPAERDEITPEQMAESWNAVNALDSYFTIVESKGPATPVPVIYRSSLPKDLRDALKGDRAKRRPDAG